MRRRLTLSFVLVLAATLAVTTTTSYVLIHRAVASSAADQITSQARAVSTTVAGGTALTGVGVRRELKVIAAAGAFTGIAVVVAGDDGTVSGGVPAGVSLSPADIRSLRDGREVDGRTASLLVWAAVPTDAPKLARGSRAERAERADRGSQANRAARPGPGQAVLIVTRQVHDPADGLVTFGLVGLAGLLVAAAVATTLSRRFTRPLGEAAATTRRIAAGDLDATVPVRPHEDAELADLAHSINAMGANLVRARDQERQFLLSVSHELRTPLTSIRGYADAMLDGTTDDPVAAATVIASEAQRLERLVQDLLDLARLDADRFSLTLQPVDGAEVVRLVADGFRPSAEALGLQLATAGAVDRPLPLRADRDRLGQILANLVENASAFAAHRIEIGCATVAGAPTVWVTDDGPGIPADRLERVFERHFTSDRRPGRRAGSGLGLAITAELAAAMGASVRAESPVDGRPGTRMTMTFASGPPPALPVHQGTLPVS